MLADHRRTAPVHGATRAPGRQDTRCDQGTQVHTVTTAQRADWFVPLELDGRDARVGGVLNRVQNGLLRSYAQRPNSRTGGDTADVGKGKRNRKSRKEGSRLDAHRRRSRWRHRTGARIAAWRSRGVDAGAVAATAVPMTNAWLELPELKLRRGRWASTRVRGRRCASASPPPSVNSGSGARQPSQLPALAHCLQPLGGSSCRGFSRSARRSSRPRRACLPVIARWCGVAIGYRLLTNWPVCRLSSERSASNAVGALNPD